MTARKKPAPKRKRRRAKATEESTPESKQKITLYLRQALLEEARGAVLALGFEGLEPSTLSVLHNTALERELQRLRRLHNAGKPFPPYRSRLPGGRPKAKG